MRLKLTFLLLMAALCTTTSAQHYKGDYVRGAQQSRNVPNLRTFCGVMAGVTAPQLSEKVGDLKIDNNLGFNMGIMWGVDFGSIEIVPEIWYQHSKVEIHDNDTKSGGELSSNSIEMPIILALKVGALRLNLGPSFTLMSNNKINSARESDVEFGEIKKMGGYVVGLSLTIINQIILDARYTGRFAARRSEWYDGGAELEYRYSTFGVNVGYRF
ncbi:MAG: outer membrane beta-barrel protein [Rikenellaceae bacterium]